MPLSRTVLMCCCLLAAASISASASASTVYKWVDENGVVNYTTTPPLDGRAGKAAKAAVVDVAPAVTGRATATDTGEAAYWRARAEREAARDLAEERQRRETEALRQARLRQELAAADKDAAKKTAAQVAAEQCRAERRIDCDTNPVVLAGGLLAATLVYPHVVVVARPATAPAAPRPYFSSPPNFTPGFSGMMMPSR